MTKGMKTTLIFLIVTYLICLAAGVLIGTCLVPEKEVKVWMPRAYYYTQTAEGEGAREMLGGISTAEDLGEFKLTAYCTCEVCCEEWADGVTASGTEATVGRTIAVDPDVIPLGSTVYINGLDYLAEDIGGAIKGNRIDVLMPTHQDALDFGVQYANVSIIRK